MSIDQLEYICIYSFEVTLAKNYPDLAMGPVAQWITRLTTDQKIPGSNPGRFGNFYCHVFQNLSYKIT